RLLKASMSDDKTELLFSRPLDTERNVNADIQIDNDAEIQSFWISHPDPKTMILKAREMVSNSEYTIKVDSVYDDLGEMLKLNNTAMFSYSDGVDTLKPEIVSTVPSNNAKNISLNAKIRIVFSEALKQTISDSSILFMSKDSIPTDYSFIWQGDNSIVLSPKTRLASGMEYRLTFDCSDWSDLAGNQFKDSLFTLSFSTVDANSFGSISGKVHLSDSLMKNLILSCIPEKEGACPVTISVPGSGIYTIDSLLPGAYRFEIWKDLNGNGKWDPGKLKPFIPAEPYRSYPDKINVRARWETAEVDWTY
ncbi:MAG: Ig-like domain-containing protein, partial [Candidatus Marinimicrobia bacterium]|nr:Ig-like domain-containing protein [Candidatus Neomarinimicrobiota bacterium]